MIKKGKEVFFFLIEPALRISKYLIYLIEWKSATNNILAKQKRRLHKRTIADSQKGKCKWDTRPMHSTALKLDVTFHPWKKIEFKPQDVR